MYSFHIKGMSEDERNTLFSTGICDPVPCKHAFRGNYDAFAERLNDLYKYFPVGFDVLVKTYFLRRIENTDIHFFGMQVDSTIKFVLFGIRFHRASPPLDSVWLTCGTQPYHIKVEALNIINRLCLKIL